MQNATDNVPLSAYDFLFHVQDKNPRTQITTAMLTESNLVTVLQSIGAKTSELLQQPVQIVPNSDFFAYIESVLQETQNFFDVYQTVCFLNNRIIQHEAGVHYHSLRRRQLYLKWFIAKDRPIIISHPIDTHGRRRLDDPTIGEYGLSNPNRLRWEQFQRSQAQF